MQYTLVAWMRDKPGVLNRVSGMLRRRNFNIDSLQVSHSETPGISRMTFVVDGDERVAEQVVKQLRKVVDVTAVEDITDRLAILRELALIRSSPRYTAPRSSTSTPRTSSCRRSAPRTR